jgi:hypothetical protein
VNDQFPRFNKKRPVNRSNRPINRSCAFIDTVLWWEPDRFVYRAGPVPPGTGRTGPVPTGFANPAPKFHFHEHKALKNTNFLD